MSKSAKTRLDGLFGRTSSRQLLNNIVILAVGACTWTTTSRAQCVAYPSPGAAPASQRGKASELMRLLPGSGPSMQNVLETYLVAKPDNIDEVLSQVATANDFQKRAIAQALRRVSQTCGDRYPASVESIPYKVLKTHDAALARMYFYSNDLAKTNRHAGADIKSGGTPSPKLPRDLDRRLEVSPGLTSDPFALPEAGL